MAAPDDVAGGTIVTPIVVEFPPQLDVTIAKQMMAATAASLAPLAPQLFPILRFVCPNLIRMNFIRVNFIRTSGSL
jgi:hypothetical protein